jgi:hypothetical protein
LRKEVHISCIAKRVTENRVNSNIFNSLYSLCLKMKRASLSMSYMIKKTKNDNIYIKSA